MFYKALGVLKKTCYIRTSLFTKLNLIWFSWLLPNFIFHLRDIEPYASLPLRQKSVQYFHQQILYWASKPQYAAESHSLLRTHQSTDMGINNNWKCKVSPVPFIYLKWSAELIKLNFFYTSSRRLLIQFWVVDGRIQFRLSQGKHQAYLGQVTNLSQGLELTWKVTKLSNIFKIPIASVGTNELWGDE